MKELVGHVGRVVQREIGMVHDALTRNKDDLRPAACLGLKLLRWGHTFQSAFMQFLRSLW